MFSNNYPIKMRRVTPGDAARLTVLAAQTFRDTYGEDNTADDMAQHVAENFSEELQRAELLDPRYATMFAERAESPVGYAMLREGPAPDCVGDPDAMEIVRIYVMRNFIGEGIGAEIMRRCIDVASVRGKDTIWLGVWEHNRRAIAFYKRWGFVDRGTQPFMLGRDRQTDRVMSRAVIEAR